MADRKEVAVQEGAGGDDIDLEEAINAKNKHLQDKINKKTESGQDGDLDDIQGIDDDYDGLDMNVKGKSVENEFVEQPKILGDDFLGELKMADVPDSDDECYF